MRKIRRKICAILCLICMMFSSVTSYSLEVEDTTLEEKEAEILRLVLDAYSKGITKLDISDIHFPKSDDTYFTMLDDMRKNGYIGLSGQYGYRSMDDEVIELELSYETEFMRADGSVNLDAISVAKHIYDAKINQVLSGIDGEMTDVDKVLYIHNWIINNVDYGDVLGQNGETLGSTWRAKGALVDGKIRCAGYAEIFKIFMDKLGIECERVSSNPMNHEWNAVKLDGKWYMVDATWDDKSSTAGEIIYSYFLKSDEEYLNNSLSTHHDWDTSAPACETSNSYEGYIFREYGQETAILGEEGYNVRRYTMDYHNGYWYYASGKSIICSKIDGSQKQTIYTSDGTKDLQSVYIFENNLYFTDLSKVYRVPLSQIESGDIIPEVYMDATNEFENDGEFFFFKFERNHIMLLDPFETPSVISKYVEMNNVYFADNELEISVGDTMEMNNLGDAADVEYYSSDSTIATVSDSGIVNGVKAGKVRILAQSGNDFDYVDVSMTAPKGDITGEGVVDDNDTNVLLQYLEGYSMDADKTLMDLNEDSEVTIEDALKLTQMIHGSQTTTLPDEKQYHVSLISDKETVGLGETVHVKVKIDKNTGINGLMTNISFLTNQFALVSVPL